MNVRHTIFSLHALRNGWRIALTATALIAAQAATAAPACDAAMMVKIKAAGLTPAQQAILCESEPAPSLPAQQQAVVQSDIEPEESPPSASPPMLESHLPTSLGLTKDTDDVAFMDANISLRYPLFYNSLQQGCSNSHIMPYFAFTGRFAQYLLTRPSSPVVMKAFNPEFFLRIYPALPYINAPDKDGSPGVFRQACPENDPDKGDLVHHNDRQIANPEFDPKKDRFANFIDIQYGHLSNGQGIVDAASLNTLASTLGGKDAAQNLAFAQDYISRGWDYFGVAGTKFGNFDDKDELTLQLRKYIGGIFQGTIEENFPWENRSAGITKLQQVSGVKIQYINHLKGNPRELGFNKWGLTFETGVQTPFRYNTTRLDTTFYIDGLGAAINFWFKEGYNSDLAQYFKHVKSGGFAIEF